MFRKIHPSVLFLAFSFSIIMGIFVNLFYRLDFLASPIWLIVAALLFLLSMGFSRRVFLVMMVLAGFLLGAWRASLSYGSSEVLRGFIGSTAEVTGTIYEDLDEKNGNMTVRLNKIRVDGGEVIESDFYASLSGVVSDELGGAVLYDQFSVKRGDILTISGKISEGFGSFAGSMYFAKIKRIVTPVPGDFSRQLRDGFATKITEHIESPESSLALGYLLGQKAALSADLMETLLVIGLTHMIVASGSALGIIISAVRRPFAKLSRQAVVIFGIGLIILFCAITGFGASIIRAGIIAIFGLIFWFFGRKGSPANLLVFVMALTLLMNPNYIFNLGWMLSFASFAGIILFHPLLVRYFYGKKKPGFLAEMLIMTLAAFIFTLPFVLFSSGRFSLASLPANLIIGPMIPLVMLTTFLTGVFAFFAPPLAGLMGWVSQKILSLHIWLMRWFENLEFLHFEVSMSAVITVIYGAVVLAVIIYLKKKTGLRFREVDLLGFIPPEQSQCQLESSPKVRLWRFGRNK